MELEDVIAKWRKEKKKENKLLKKKRQDASEKRKEDRKKLMKFTSSTKWKLSEDERKQLWRIFKARTKQYYNFPRGVVYLSSIPHGFYEEQMASYFSQFGKVTGIYMPRSSSGKSRGYAFIEFQLELIAKIVAESMNNYLFYQRILKAKYIPPEKQKPYMFVFPFGDKRLKSRYIELEKERRLKSLNETDVVDYKRKVHSKMERKLKALGANYAVQVAGAVPPSVSLKDKKKKSKTSKAKENDGSKEKDAVEDKKPKASQQHLNLFEESMTKKIKQNIAQKLSQPLVPAMNDFKSTQSSDEERESENEADFHTAEEDNSFMSLKGFSGGESSDDDFEFFDDAFDDDDDEEEDEPSPAKKSKPMKKDNQLNKKSTPKNKIQDKLSPSPTTSKNEKSIAKSSIKKKKSVEKTSTKKIKSVMTPPSVKSIEKITPKKRKSAEIPSAVSGEKSIDEKMTPKKRRSVSTPSLKSIEKSTEKMTPKKRQSVSTPSLKSIEKSTEKMTPKKRKSIASTPSVKSIEKSAQTTTPKIKKSSVTPSIKSIEKKKQKKSLSDTTSSAVSVIDSSLKTDKKLALQGLGGKGMKTPLKSKVSKKSPLVSKTPTLTSSSGGVKSDKKKKRINEELLSK